MTSDDNWVKSDEEVIEDADRFILGRVASLLSAGRTVLAIRTLSTYRQEYAKAERRRVLVEVERRALLGIVRLDNNNDTDGECMQVIKDVCAKVREEL